MIYVIENKRLKNGPLEISYDIIQLLQFKCAGIDNVDGLYIACGLDLQHSPSELLFYSDDVTLNENIISFNVNTYTENFLSKVTKFATKAWLEIGRMLEGNKSVILFDDIIVQPRVYLEGTPPEPVPSSEYATMLWVSTNFQRKITQDNKLDASLISGDTWVSEDELSSYQEKINEAAKLDYSLLSSTPTIGDGTIYIYQGADLKGKFTLNQLSSTTIDLDAGGGGGGGVTSSWVDENYQKIISNSRKLSYSLLSGTPTIPTVNNSTISIAINGVTSSFTLNQSSAKTLSFTVEGGGGVTSSWVDENYQKIISNTNKLPYSLISGTPTIPTKTSDLTNDSNFATSAYVGQEITSHNLAIDAHSSLFGAKQNVIDSSHKLAYSLLSGTPTIPTDYLSGISLASTPYTVTDHVVTIPKATVSVWGMAKVYNGRGLAIDSNNGLYVTQASAAEISGRSTQYKTISPNNLNLAVSAALVDSNKIAFSEADKIILQSQVGVNNPTITFTQGGVTKGSITLNQASSETIALDAGGGGAGGMLYNRIYSSDTILTAFHDCSYFWALQDQDATLYIESPMLLQQSDFDIPIDINLSGSTVTLSGITRVGNFINGFLHRCLITRRYDKSLLYIYRVEDAYPMTQGLVGNWTTLGTDSSTYAGAAQVYTETTAGHYDSADGTYFIEARGTNWRLFTSDDTDIAMGPLASDPMQGEYATVAMAPLAGDSVLTVKLENIIVRS